MAQTVSGSARIISIMFVASAVTWACEDPPTDGSPSEPSPPAVNEESDPTTDEPGADLPRGEGRIRFTVQGGVFPSPVSFEKRSEDMRALISGSTLNVLHRPSDDWVGEDGEARVKTLIFSITEPPTPGTYDSSQYSLNFVLSPDADGDRAKSISTTGQPGTITITERTDDHVTGTFDLTGRATQVQSTEPVYTLRGEFSFARRRARRE